MQNGSWDRECGRNLLLFQSEVALKRWYIVYPNMVERETQKFVNRAKELASNMGFQIGQPRPHSVRNDKELANAVDSLAQSNPQMIFFVVASNKNNNADMYVLSSFVSF